MKSPIYVDANWLIALFVDNHPFHPKAKADFQKNENKEYVISHLTIDEVLYGLRKYRIPSDQIIFLIQNFSSAVKLKSLDLESNSETIDQYLKVWSASKLAPRDALHLFIIEMHKIKSVFTFDGEFKDYFKKNRITISNN